MTISFEISSEHVDKYPPFVDGCPSCRFAGVVVPFATLVQGDQLNAFYAHGRCGHEWRTAWSAQWDHSWVRVGPEPRRELPSAPRTLPSGNDDTKAAA